MNELNSNQRKILSQAAQTLKPVIQIGFGGTKGRVHGTTFEVYDKEKAYVEPVKLIALSVMELLKNPEMTKEIANTYKSFMTYDEYTQYLERK